MKTVKFNSENPIKIWASAISLKNVISLTSLTSPLISSVTSKLIKSYKFTRLIIERYKF